MGYGCESLKTQGARISQIAFKYSENTRFLEFINNSRTQPKIIDLSFLSENREGRLDLYKLVRLASKARETDSVLSRRNLGRSAHRRATTLLGNSGRKTPKITVPWLTPFRVFCVSAFYLFF